MLGPIIGITTSIATMTAVACAQAGAAAITGGGRRHRREISRRLVIRKDASAAIERLGVELMAERAKRKHAEAQCERLRDTIVLAQQVIDDLMLDRAG